ncbi:MAG: DUF983 domain-containing protein [Deltaproteobacteria bacterium]
MNHLSLARTLWNGIRGFCPSCGRGSLFKSWFLLNEHCSHCECLFQSREDDTYFFMYMSTGFITGIFIVGMFFIIPNDIKYGKLILLALSLLLFIATHPFRKGLAVAIDFYVDSRSEYPKHREKNDVKKY